MSYDIGFLLDGLILVFLCVTIFYAARLSLFLKSFREGRDGMQLLIRELTGAVDKAQAAIKSMKAQAIETEEELRMIVNEAKFHSDELRFMNETGDSLAERLEKLANRNRELVDLLESSGGIGVQKIKTESDPWDVNKTAKRSFKPREEPLEDDGFEIHDFDINDMDIDEDDERDFLALDDGAYKEELTHQSKVNTQAKSKVRSFAIFDRDHAEGQENIIKDDLALKALDQPARPQTSLSAPAKKPVASSGFQSKAEQDLYEALQRRKNARVNEVS